MSKTGPTSATRLFGSFKLCVKRSQLTYSILNAHVPRGYERLHGLLNGSPDRPPTPGNVALLAKAIFKFVQNPAPAALSKSDLPNVKIFWKRFCRELRKLSSKIPARLDSEEALTEAFYEILGLSPDHSLSTGFSSETKTQSRTANDAAPNPFICGNPIRDDAAFFGRERELRRLRDLLRTGQNCQIVGPRRIGKSSLLLAMGRRAVQWLPRLAFAYVDMQDARCHTQASWLRVVAGEWEWPTPFRDLAELVECAHKLFKNGRRPVLGLDEFEEFVSLRAEFPLKFFEGLRAVAQTRSLTIITAAQSSLHDLCERNPDLSAFYNIFPLLRLERFTSPESADFVGHPRPGLQSFSPEETEQILRRAGRHPLKLQCACYEAVERRLSGDSFDMAMQRAEEAWRGMLPRSEWEEP